MTGRSTVPAVAWLVPAATLLLGGWGARPASAEPTFLSKQYPRCTACHYSAAGGRTADTLRAIAVTGGDLDLRPTGDERGPGRRIDRRRGGLPVRRPVEREPAAAWPRRPALARGRRRAGPHHRQPQLPDEPGSAGRLAAGPLDGVRLRRARAARRRRARLLRALGRLAGHGHRQRAGRALSSGLRCPVRRPHVVHPRAPGPRRGRPGLRHRAGRVDRPHAAAGVGRPGTRRVPHRRRWTAGVHHERPVPDRPGSADGRRGVRVVSRRIGYRPAQHEHRPVLRVRAGPVVDDLDARRRAVPEACRRAAGPTSSPTRRRWRHFAASGSGSLPNCAGPIRTRGARYAAWCTAWISTRAPIGTSTCPTTGTACPSVTGARARCWRSCTSTSDTSERERLRDTVAPPGHRIRLSVESRAGPVGHRSIR